MSSHTEIMRCTDDLGEEWSLSIHPMVVNDCPLYHIIIQGSMFSSLSIVAGHARFRNVEIASSTGRFVIFRFAPGYGTEMDDFLMTKVTIQEVYSANVGGVNYYLEVDSFAVHAEIPVPSELCRNLLYVLDQLCGHLPEYDDA